MNQDFFLNLTDAKPINPIVNKARIEGSGTRVVPATTLSMIGPGIPPSSNKTLPIAMSLIIPIKLIVPAVATDVNPIKLSKVSNIEIFRVPESVEVYSKPKTLCPPDISIVNARNVKNDIIAASKNIDFTEQYQVDEFIGKPFRRIIVRHFKIVYFPENDSSIIILEIFDSYRSPFNLRKQ